MIDINYQPYVKVLISGNILEFTHIDIPLRISEKQTKNKHKNLKKNQDRNYNLCKQNLLRLIRCNTDLTKFVTLTYKNNIKNRKKAYNDLKQFTTKLKLNYPNLKYISIIEYQKRGAIHFHLLMNIPYIKHNFIEKLWNKGFIKINYIKNIANTSLYLTKYFTKDTFNRLYKEKKYTSSRNLKKPNVYINQKAIDIFSNLKLKNISNCHFISPFMGLIKYEQYQII